MCGVPYHAAEGYIARLIQKGYRVAICDQMEDPPLAKKLVKREVTRIVTPGTATDAHLLRSHENNYLAAVARNGARAGVAHVDVSTGEFRVTEMEPAEVAGALEQLGAREVLFPADLPLLAARGQTARRSAHRNSKTGSSASTTPTARCATTSSCCRSMAAAWPAATPPCAPPAPSCTTCATRSAPRSTTSTAPPTTTAPRAMVLDAVTVRNLELIEPVFADDGRWGNRRRCSACSIRPSPAWAAACCGSACCGPRWTAPKSSSASTRWANCASKPSCAPNCASTSAASSTWSACWPRSRSARRPARPARAGPIARKIPALKTASRTGSPPACEPARAFDDVPEARDRILAAIADEPPVNLADGGAIRAGYHAELDELRDLSQNGRQYIAQIEARERARTGIQSLKVRFNNVFGYYIEISKANLHLAPADYERKQTLVNAERFTTPELKDYERKVLDAEDKILALEKELFAEVRQLAADHGQRIRATAAAIAELDVTAALAQVAAENRYAGPRFPITARCASWPAAIPVIERLTEQEAGRFIPNDLFLNSSTDLIAIITGPNMGGKSTYLRQAALIALLAQMGSFVPADSAQLPLIDRIFTRIGASDNLARGRSTFMVEMTETAVILNTATPRSLIVLDEIGRGTATYDGLALAWAVVEHIHARTRAKTLFATHYHELTELAELLDGVRNLRVSVKEAGDHIIFLRKVEPGRADRSYGIEVARLAGLPLSVIERAREVLKLPRKDRPIGDGGAETGPRASPTVRSRGPQHRRAHPRTQARRAAAHRSAATARRVAGGAEALVRVAGIMSGTSLDGVDVAIVDIEGQRIETVAFRSTPYTAAMRRAILDVSTPAAISRLNFRLGEIYAKAVLELDAADSADGPSI